MPTARQAKAIVRGWQRREGATGPGFGAKIPPMAADPVLSYALDSHLHSGPTSTSDATTTTTAIDGAVATASAAADAYHVPPALAPSMEVINQQLASLSQAYHGTRTSAAVDHEAGRSSALALPGHRDDGTAGSQLQLRSRSQSESPPPSSAATGQMRHVAERLQSGHTTGMALSSGGGGDSGSGSGSSESRHRQHGHQQRSNTDDKLDSDARYAKGAKRTPTPSVDDVWM